MWWFQHLLFITTFLSTFPFDCVAIYDFFLLKSSIISWSFYTGNYLFIKLYCVYLPRKAKRVTFIKWLDFMKRFHWRNSAQWNAWLQTSFVCTFYHVVIIKSYTNKRPWTRWHMAVDAELIYKNRTKVFSLL